MDVNSSSSTGAFHCEISCAAIALSDLNESLTIALVIITLLPVKDMGASACIKEDAWEQSSYVNALQSVRVVWGVPCLRHSSP
jgi:hypothetical protein